jgi:hypothetical protein
MTPLPNPFMTDEPKRGFVLDEEAFFDAIEPPPKFLRNPSPQYMTAIELMPIVEILQAFK